jgi:hypothetical protein
MLAASLRKYGQPKPILVRKANRMIAAGHGLVAAAKLAGLTEITCALWDVDQATADAYMVADNRLGDLSEHDPDLLGVLLGEVGDSDLFAMGFTEDDIDGLFGASDPIKVQEIDSSSVEDRFWISVKGPLAAQAEALERLKKVMAELRDIEVELGTTAA